MGDFEWDDAKSEWTKRTRGFDFRLASRIFDGPMLVRIDDRRNYGEVRLRAIGRINDDILVVVYTWRGEQRRIISARMANGKERDEYRTIHG